MPPRPERASRQRQLLKGSVYEINTRCGKPSCHCAAPDGARHRNPVLSWSYQGKTQLHTLPAKDLDRIRRLTENYRQFRQTRAALVKLHQRTLTTIDRLEKALRLPPPRPVSRKRKR